MANYYPDYIELAVNALCAELEKHRPDVFVKRYDGCGYQNEDGQTFKDRMIMCLYIELIKAGVITS
jgi:hypothetical protein